MKDYAATGIYVNV